MRDFVKRLGFVAALLSLSFAVLLLGYSLSWLGTHYHEGYQYPSLQR